jgi:phage terminase large subunit-like protein
MQFDKARYERLSPKQRELFDQLAAAHRDILEANPLQGFHACAEPCGAPGCQARARQHEFMAATERIVAAFAGNRFGKTTANVVWSIIQHTPDEMLPKRLLGFKRPRPEGLGAVTGRYLCPSQKAIETIVLPEMRKWMPTNILRGGGWDKAYSKQHNIVYFEDSGRLEFYTFEQDAAVMVGASLDYVIYDEPPPEAHFRENVVRTTDRAGCHRFGMTPVNMKGGGIGWIKREILDRKDDPNFRVVRASIHDNPLLSAEEIAFTLSQFPEDERQAREHGDFIHFGGMCYPGGFDRIMVEPILPVDRGLPERLRFCDIYVGIDPGLKNAAFVWIAFDNENNALVFDEVLLQEKTPIDYVNAVRRVNSRWNLSQPPIYVIDPSARNRSLTNAESIQSELERHGIYCVHGQNAVEAGVQQVRRRIKGGSLHITENCTGLRAEADEYRMEDRPDGEFKVVKENDHRLDAMRYALMARPWYPDLAASLRAEQWTPGIAPSHEWLNANAPDVDQTYGPMGSLA